MKYKKIIYIILATICLVLGIVGIAIPILPTFPFFLIAFILSAKSSDRINKFILSTKFYEKNMKSYIEEKTLSKASKIKLFISLSIIFFIALFFMFKKEAYIAICIVFVVYIAHIIYFGFFVKTTVKENNKMMYNKHMAIITKIETQVKNKERCNLYLDGEFYASLEKIVCLNNRLKEGESVDAKKLEELVFDSEKERAFTYAVEYICKYLPTKKQLIHKLYEKKLNKKLVEYVIEKCEEYGYIDDLKYAQNYIYQNKNIKGKLRLEKELMLKGIDKTLIYTALEDYKEEDGCLKLAQKRARNKDLDDPKVYASLLRYLQYRGYEFDEIKRCIDIIKEKDD